MTAGARVAAMLVLVAVAGAAALGGSASTDAKVRVQAGRRYRWRVRIDANVSNDVLRSIADALRAAGADGVLGETAGTSTTLQYTLVAQRDLEVRPGDVINLGPMTATLVSVREL